MPKRGWPRFVVFNPTKWGGWGWEDIFGPINQIKSRICLVFFGCPSPLLSAWPPASMSFLSSVEGVDSPSRNRWESTSRVIYTSLLTYVIMSSQASPTSLYIYVYIVALQLRKTWQLFVSPIQCHLSTDLGGETAGTSACGTWKLLAPLDHDGSSLPASNFTNLKKASKSSRSKNAPYIFL